MPKPQPPEHCLNCGARLTGAYCAQCGQAASDFRMTFSAMLIEFIDNQFDLNSALIRSVLALIFKPGTMTREYNAGKRVRYVSPVRMYLVTSAIFFLLLARQTSFAEFLDLGNWSGDITQVEVATPSPDGGAILDDNGQPVIFPLNDQGQPRPITLGDLSQREPVVRFAIERWQAVTRNGLEVFRERFTESFFDNIPQMMFVLLPVAALILKLLYIRRPWLYIEHVTFALHLHTFAFIVIILGMVTGPFVATLPVPEDIGSTVSLWGIAVYTLVAMRVVYQQSYLKTAAKLVLFFISYSVTLTLSLAITSAVAFLLL